MYEILKKAYLDSEIVMMGDYPYFINAISDGNPQITCELLDEVVHGISSSIKLECDLIIAPEAMGIPYATAMTMRTGIPFQIIRKKKLGLPGEIEIACSTGYSESRFYLNYLEEGTRVLIIDDVISTGGTLKALVAKLKEAGVIVQATVVVLNKSKDLKALSDEIGIEIIPLMNVSVEDGKPIILD